MPNQNNKKNANQIKTAKKKIYNQASKQPGIINDALRI